VLIDKSADDEFMELLLLILLVAVGPLAVLWGSDSRSSDTRVKTRWI
jgi:hypothetical protein